MKLKDLYNDKIKSLQTNKDALLQLEEKYGELEADILFDDNCPNVIRSNKLKFCSNDLDFYYEDSNDDGDDALVLCFSTSSKEFIKIEGNRFNKDFVTIYSDPFSKCLIDTQEDKIQFSNGCKEVSKFSKEIQDKITNKIIEVLNKHASLDFDWNTRHNLDNFSQENRAKIEKVLNLKIFK